MNIFGMTDIGVDRDSNQDAYHAEQIEDAAVAIVCDGMGGVNGGNVASSMAVESILRVIKESYAPGADGETIKNILISAVTEANADIYNRSVKEKEFFGMGTTAVVALITQNGAHIVHVGDSRAYIFDNDGLRQVTVDHSFVQELVLRGEITQSDAQSHPQKNLITRAVGVQKKLLIDHNSFELGAGNLVLLCSDGLTNMCSDAEITRVITQSDFDVPLACKRLIGLANDYGGADNITAVLVRI